MVWQGGWPIGLGPALPASLGLQRRFAVQPGHLHVSACARSFIPALSSLPLALPHAFADLHVHHLAPSRTTCAGSIVSEAETEWSDGVAVSYRAQQLRQGVGFAALIRQPEVWAICVAQYTGERGCTLRVGLPGVGDRKGGLDGGSGL